MAKFCEYCGAPLKDGAKFCTGCGHAVAAKPQPQPQPNPQPQPSRQPEAEPTVQAPKPKKKGGCGKVLLIVALIAVVGYGGWEFYQNREAKRTRERLTKDYPEKMKELEQRQQKTGGAFSGDIEFDDGDDSPKNVLNGEGYRVEVPQSEREIKCKEATDEEIAELSRITNMQFFGRPVNVTQNGKDHVQFDQMARVSFDIPNDIPKDKYMNLIGVLVTDGCPLYMVPEYEGLQKGVISFETSHFCTAGGGIVPDEDMRNAFKERVAAGNFMAGMSEKDFEKTAKEKLNDVAALFNLGEDDLLGMVAQEMLSDNSTVKKISDVIDVYDEKDPEKAQEKIQEMVMKETLNRCLAKLKEGVKKDKVEYDELHDKYVHTMVTEDKAIKKYVEKFEKHLTQENMQKIGTELGGGDPNLYAEKLCGYFEDQAKERLKELSLKLVPQIKYIQMSAKVMKAIKKFWASNEMADMYATYKKYAESDGRMSNDDWNAFMFRRANAAVSKFGITEEEIRQQFFERFQNEKEIHENMIELEKDMRAWEKNGDLGLVNKRIFGTMGLDYVQRLSRLGMLTERFRDDLFEYKIVDKYTAPGTIRSLTMEIVDNYLDYYPEHEKFNEWYEKWLAKKGYRKEKGGAGYCWRLVRTEIDKSENVKTDIGIVRNYFASETEHRVEGVHIGNGYKAFPFSFVATIQAPPELIQGGDSLVLHATLRRVDGAAEGYIFEDVLFLFEDESIPQGFSSDGAIGAKIINLDGSTRVGVTPDTPSSGTWDYVIHIPSGKKDELKAFNYSTCGSRTHWVYKWCSASE